MNRLIVLLLLASVSYAVAGLQTSAGSSGTTLTNSASLASALSDETGTGAAVFGTSPTITTGLTMAGIAPIFFGPADASHPMLEPTGNGLRIRFGDSSAHGYIEASHFDLMNPGRVALLYQNGLWLSSTGYVQFSTGSDPTSGGGPVIKVGSNSPEGAVTAAIGSIFLRSNGGASTTLYVKESGSGNTGWIAK
jgi:hypothetical protein